MTHPYAGERKRAAGATPGHVAARRAATGAGVVREAVFARGWTRLDAAVASSPGRRHAVNEDGYSALDGIRTTVRGGGRCQLWRNGFLREP